jgi:hypothetical protein
MFNRRIQKPNDNPASQTPTSAIFTIAAFNQKMLNDESCGLYHKIDLKFLPSQNHHILNNTNGIQQHYIGKLNTNKITNKKNL